MNLITEGLGYLKRPSHFAKGDKWLFGLRTVCRTWTTEEKTQLTTSHWENYRFWCNILERKLDLTYGKEFYTLEFMTYRKKKSHRNRVLYAS